MGRANHVAKICTKYKSIRLICVGISFMKFDQNQSNNLREIVGVRLNWWRGAMLLPTRGRSTGGRRSTGNTFQDLPRLRDIADNTERYI